tara:strand:+ start:1955 stop:2977 length:1023 start_codon:yes stop_codon:yes gene_type:complete
MDLTGMETKELESFVNDLGEKKFRGNQIFSWIQQHGITDISQMTTLTKQFRDSLKTKAKIQAPHIIDITKSTETYSQKFLFELDDGMKIESVYLPEGKRRTVCLSSQIGCPLDCKFCATGKMGFIRNLSVGEILGQLLSVKRNIEERITNVVFMGMGEPMLNYNNVIKAAKIINDYRGLNISSRKITISTVGIAKKIRKLADDKVPFKLAFSLNATDDKSRNFLMPINKKFDLEECILALKYYNQKLKKRVTLEYVLIAGINDRDEDVKNLSSIMKKINCNLNLIPYNPILGENFNRPNRAQLTRFFEKVSNGGRTITVRWSQGKDINAACGQLYANNHK